MKKFLGMAVIALMIPAQANADDHLIYCDDGSEVEGDYCDQIDQQPRARVQPSDLQLARHEEATHALGGDEVEEYVGHEKGPQRPLHLSQMRPARVAVSSTQSGRGWEGLSVDLRRTLKPWRATEKATTRARPSQPPPRGRKMYLRKKSRQVLWNQFQWWERETEDRR